MIQNLLQMIRNARLDLSNEKRAQADLEVLLTAAGIPFEREVRLTERDIVDFLVPVTGVQGIGIELKLKGIQKKQVYRQLVRYAQHERIEVLILASTLSMGLPEEINGKDVYFVKLGEGWL